MVTTRTGAGRRAAVPLSRRRFLLATGGLGLAAAGTALLGGCENITPSARGNDSPQVHRAGWLCEGEPSTDATPHSWPAKLPPTARMFTGRLAELGYIDGQTLHWQFRSGSTDAQLAAQAEELAALNLDVIVVLSSFRALRAVMQAPGNTPVVMVACSSDPVGDGIAERLARPGGRVTGVTVWTSRPQIRAKWLEAMKDTVPALARLGVLLDVHEENLIGRDLSTLGPPAQALGIELIVEEVRNWEQIGPAVSTLAARGAEGLLPLVRTRWSGINLAQELSPLALRHRLPLNGIHRVWTEAGALVSYFFDLQATFSRGADYVDKVLRGARPAVTPIENPDKFELIINLKTAEALGLTIPPAVLARAAEVIR